MNKKTNGQNGENLLDLIPVHSVEWEKNGETNTITLKKLKFQNTYLRKNLLPRLKNPYFRINLDKIGSHVWLTIDGRRSVLQIADNLAKTFGSDVDPVYERVGQFIRSLEKSSFITYRR